MMQNAKNPLAIVGGGARCAEIACKDFLFKYNLPFVATWAAKDMFSSDYLGYIGDFGITGSVRGNKAVQEADLLIVLGSRLDTHQTGNNLKAFAPNAKKIMIDIDLAELFKDNGILIDRPIHADLRAILPILNANKIR